MRCFLYQCMQESAFRTNSLTFMGEAGRRLAKRLFSPAVAAMQVVDALAGTKTP